MAAPPIKTPAEIEAEIIANERINTADAEFNADKVEEMSRRDRKNFNIRHGAKLPEKFINGEPGSTDHLCADGAGIYRKDWFQVIIYSQYPGQANPQEFHLGALWKVPLDTWVDVPPEIIESLNSAVETHHNMDFKPGDIIAGKPAVDVVTTRRRFVWDRIPSA
jgi:hypothetical protein